MILSENKRSTDLAQRGE